MTIIPHVAESWAPEVPESRQGRHLTRLLALCLVIQGQCNDYGFYEMLLPLRYCHPSQLQAFGFVMNLRRTIAIDLAGSDQ